MSLGGKFFDIELWRTLSLNTYKLSHTLSLHRKKYFEYFIRQLRLFSIIYSFLTYIVLKIFCLRELLWAWRLDFNVLSIWFILKGSVPGAVRNISRDFSHCEGSLYLEKFLIDGIRVCELGYSSLNRRFRTNGFL